jgi:hypothetical protein
VVEVAVQHNRRRSVGHELLEDPPRRHGACTQVAQPAVDLRQCLHEVLADTRAVRPAVEAFEGLFKRAHRR